MTATLTGTGAPAGTPAARGNAVASTPSLRTSGRRAVFWILAAGGTLLVAILGTLLAGGGARTGEVLGADNAGQAGAQALAEVLRQQGVHVDVVGTLAEARSVAGTATDATLFFHDGNGYLTAGQLRDMAGLAPRTVVVAPDFLLLQTLAPTVGFGGAADTASDAPEARCALPAAIRAGTVSPGGPALSVRAGSTAFTGCFPVAPTSYALVTGTTPPDGTPAAGPPASALTLVADAGLFSNEKITGYGNAALALNLLGQGDELIWYLPTLADVAVTGPPSLGELTPGWVTPSILLFVAVFLAAAVWRGRRLGPLVAENLPVTVRASETMEGRARLYARGNARLRALDSLRVGTLQRLAARVGLSRLAGLDDIVLAVAALTDRPPGEVRTVLVDGVPAGDAELVAFSDRLRELERAADAASGLPATPAASIVTAVDPAHQPPASGRMDP